MKKKKIIAIMIVALLIIAIFGYWYISKNKEEEIKYMTAKELNEFLDKANTPFNNITDYKEFHIKDTPIGLEIIKLPNITYNQPYWWKGEPQVNTNIVDFYTFVNFGDGNYLLFIGNKSKDFPLNKEVKFTFPVKKYYIDFPAHTPGYPRYSYTIESIYCEVQLSKYSVVVNTKIFTPINYTQEFTENNTKVLVRITNISNFYPVPVRWKDIGVILFPDDINLPIKISIYNFQNTLIGTIEKQIKHNGSITPVGWSIEINNDSYIQVGNYFTFEYLEEYNNTTIYLWENISLPFYYVIIVRFYDWEQTEYWK